MKCHSCGNEMLVDRVEEKEDTLIFHYKCPNPNCVNRGFERAKPEDDKTK